MSFTKTLFSKKFFLVNLVLIGILLGFSGAFLLLSKGAVPSLKKEAIVNAESAPAAAISGADAILVAESLQKAFNNVATVVLPSVVELDVVSQSAGGSKTQDLSPFRFFFGEPGSQEGTEAPKEQGLGSGIIIRKSGKKYFVLTNNHVIAGATQITVKLFDEREFTGTVTGFDERRDLAVVSFENDGANIAVASLGNSDVIKVGDWAIAIGSPFGLFSSVTTGIISALGRDGGPDGNINDFIQTDAAINRGNSGGALVNIKGEVIGINTWIASPTGGNIGLGFSIPINNTKRAVDDIISKGSVRYGWLGVSLLMDVGRETLLDMSIADVKGAMIGHVFTDGPGAKSGLLPGDLVTTIDGKAINSTEQLIRMVGDLPVGSKSVFSVIRYGKKLEVKVLIEERKDQSAQSYSTLWPGIEVSALTKAVVAELKLAKDITGILLVSILPRTPAVSLGLKEGDILTMVNDTPLKTVSDFFKVINEPKTKKIQFTVLREGQTLNTLALVRK